jgi:hypothetical protein
MESGPGYRAVDIGEIRDRGTERGAKKKEKENKKKKKKSGGQNKKTSSTGLDEIRTRDLS